VYGGKEAIFVDNSKKQKLEEKAQKDGYFGTLARVYVVWCD